MSKFTCNGTYPDAAAQPPLPQCPCQVQRYVWRTALLFEVRSFLAGSWPVLQNFENVVSVWVIYKNPSIGISMLPDSKSNLQRIARSHCDLVREELVIESIIRDGR